MAGNLDHDTVIGRYYALVYAQTQNYEAAAQRLNTNWRTVKSRMDMAFLERLKSS
jgi:DNA-directed RNA polymerase specialized sigma24 family protein